MDDNEFHSRNHSTIPTIYIVSVGNKMHKAFPLPVIEFPLTEEVPTASEESCHCQKKREATAMKIALLGEGSGTPTEPHHTPSPEAHPTLHTTHSSATLPPVTTTSIPTSSALLPVADEPASPLRDVSEGEACPTKSGLGADQDRATIAKTSTLPYDSAPRVTSPAAAEGSMQQTLNELIAFCTSLQRQHSELISKFEAQELEINKLKAKVKLLEDREGVAADRSRDDAPIKGRNLDEREAAAEDGSIPTAGSPATKVPTGSDGIPTTSLVFATATVVTPYTRRKGKETLVESETPKKKKIQEIHVEEEPQSMIDGLDRSNETVAKYLQEYQQFASELPLERRIELISDLVRYQDNYAKVHKYQTQQRNPCSKKQKKDYYMAVIKSNLGWKVKDFKGMTFEEIEAKFTIVWKQLEDFIPMGSKEEAERLKRKGLSIEQESVKQSLLMKFLKKREDLNQLWALVKESLSNKKSTSDKEMELWVELKSDLQGQRNFHACGEGLPSEEGSGNYDDLLQASSGELLRRIVGNKMHKAFPLPVIEFPLAEEVPTASEESFHCQKKREATAVKIALLDSSCSSDGANLYGERATGAAPGTNSIWNSTCRIGGPSTRVASPRLVDPPVRTPRCSEAFMRWKSTPLSTLYRPTTSESSLDSSFERSLDPSLPSVGPSRKRCRSPTTLVPSSTPFTRLIAPALADLLPRKRFRDLYSFEVSGEEHMEMGTADAKTVTDLSISEGVRAHTEDGIYLGIEVATSDIREEEEEEFKEEASEGGTMEIVVNPLATGDFSEPSGGDAPDLEGTLYDISHYMNAVPLDRIIEFETAQRQLEDGQLEASRERASLADRVRSLRRENLREEFCQLCRDRDDTRRRLRRLESLVKRRLGFRQAIEELVNRRVEEALAAYEATRAANTLEAESQSQNGNDDDNGNGGNRNGNPNVNDRGASPVARECTYQDFMKCEPLNFKGTKGVVGLIRWFEKMEKVFHISNYVAFSMSGRELTKLMTEVYCPRNEIQKMESELWNLTMKNNDLVAYTQRFQELTMLCTKMVHEEEDQVKRFIGGLLDNIQGNVIAVEPTRLQDVVRIANNLMDQKLKGYATKNAKNKRRLEVNQRDNRGQQPPIKRQNIRGLNVARAYTAGNNEKRRYVGPLPYCSKCKLHHKGPCTVKGGKCKKVRNMTRDCMNAVVVPATQRALVVNQRVPTCFECERQGHYRNECSKLKNQNRGNKTRNKNGIGEARGKAYVLGEGDANPSLNVVTCTFLFNNHYAFVLFDSGFDRIFVSTTLSHRESTQSLQHTRSPHDGSLTNPCR
nr:hypothetical protein [Tanacetum cinerariifolium]